MNDQVEAYLAAGLDGYVVYQSDPDGDHDACQRCRRVFTREEEA